MFIFLVLWILWDENNQRFIEIRMVMREIFASPTDVYD
jgi:hypothetical protein